MTRLLCRLRATRRLHLLLAIFFAGFVLVAGGPHHHAESAGSASCSLRGPHVHAAPVNSADTLCTLCQWFSQIHSAPPEAAALLLMRPPSAVVVFSLPRTGHFAAGVLRCASRAPPAHFFSFS